MWAKIEVFNYDKWIGSFYERDLSTKQKIVEAINKEYGSGNWTRWTLEY
jgi:hypothetical protein